MDYANIVAEAKRKYQRDDAVAKRVDSLVKLTLEAMGGPLTGSNTQLEKEFAGTDLAENAAREFWIVGEVTVVRFGPNQGRVVNPVDLECTSTGYRLRVPPVRATFDLPGRDVMRITRWRTLGATRATPFDHTVPMEMLTGSSNEHSVDWSDLVCQLDRMAVWIRE